MPQKLGETTYYTPSEVAAIIGKHYNSALDKIRKGLIESVVVNGGYLVSHSAMLDYLEEVQLPASIIDLRLGNKLPKTDAEKTNQP